jgi:hypothetical protein
LCNKRPLADSREALDAESLHLVIALENRQGKFDAILNDAVLAQELIAAANVVALEQHWRVGVVKVRDEATVDVVPILQRNLRTLTVF